MTFPTQQTRLHPCVAGPTAGRPDGPPNELLIVEGQSASKSVLALRDATFQAVLPMQGKPLNAAKASAKAVRSNPLYCSLAEAIGAGWGNDFQVERVRFQRIVLLFDPDADGIHCGVLVTLFFDRWMPGLVESGRVVVARVPLFEITAGDANDVGYALDEMDLADQLESLRQSGHHPRHRRFRGLAGLPTNVLRRTGVVPETRICQRIGPRDVVAMKSIFLAGQSR
ncbi:toprim domain-containing protein [Crateriforma conspicua]|uniref:DNA topoisomerase (ATP-hydrolyzing) n=1 Tax=Crateriforma conspicua TaxID=2527996 RepID=A0A5C6FK55_9PLAN|nr:DNA topoisomerase 4 subunit B [Crateriforma conspicua]